MEKIIKTLQEVNNMKDLMTVNTVTPGGFPKLKIIYNNKEFMIWKENTLRILQSLKEDKIITDTIDLLENGFKGGWNDESDLKNLQAKINIIIKDIDDFMTNKEDVEIDTPKKLKKGTVVKTTFDEYTLIKQVGQGGNGRVFSATNLDGDSVAIKFVMKNISREKTKRFKNEINFCERHKHKNIVELLDRGYKKLDNEEYIFYVMPLYKETLRDKINAKIKHEDAEKIFIGLLEGLEYVHDFEVIHRDIKPENIMFNENSLEPIICDFGIAHFVEDEMLTCVETNVDSRMANHKYAAPEQNNKKKEVTKQTDIYAAGLILIEMFTDDIPGGTNYKKIESVAPEYKYLDDVFEKLYEHEAHKRLYPVKNIIDEINKLKGNCTNVQENLVISEVISTEDFTARVTNLDYTEGYISFNLESKPPYNWLQSFRIGLSCYSDKLMSDICRNDIIYGTSTISIPISADEYDDNIKKIVENIIDLINKTNKRYSEVIKRLRIDKQQEKEEIKKRDSHIMDILNSIDLEN